jgi:flagellar hook-basal body complex protein FliE
MDALSALRSLATPELRNVAPKTIEDISSQAISSDDLAKLGQLSSKPTGLSGTNSLGTGPASDTFSDTLHQFVSEVNSKQAAAGDATKGLLSGSGVSLQQAMIAMEEASVSFQLMVEVRNKLLDSYQELMRMQV